MNLDTAIARVAPFVAVATAFALTFYVFASYFH